MNNFDFIRFSNITQISTALTLIVGLLLYIAYRLTPMGRGKKGKKVV